MAVGEIRRHLSIVQACMEIIKFPIQGVSRMTRKFDLVVMGTGAAASSAAFRCRSAGWHVGIIDSRPFGGTCPLRG